MQYAPVIIPTLNRYEHFKRCLESLERCTGANKTEVYVGLDYPPAEKYVEGWKKIDEYLKEKEQNNGFAKLIVKRRDHNLGICNPSSNANTLLKEIPEDSWSYIFTEDDKEFSPCFLEYMNQNLEKYRDDAQIFRICGYLSLHDELPEVGDYTQFKADRYNGWGIGCWIEKEKYYRFYNTKNGILELLKSQDVQRYFEKDKIEEILVSLVKMSKTNSRLGDVLVASLLEFSKSRCIYPTVSMVRNYGSDGSGQHGTGYVPGYLEQEIQTSLDYYMKEAPCEFTEIYEAELHRRRRSTQRNINNVQNLVSWRLYKLTGVLIEFNSLRKVAKNLKRFINDKQ